MPDINISLTKKQAIEAALNQDWTRASNLNQKILKTDSKNIDALNRLAKAKIELEKPDEAKKILNQVLSQDKYNTIALTNKEKLKSKRNKSSNNQHCKFQTISFIEEPGKTKTINLINLGQKQIINELQPGEEVIIHPLKRKLKVLNQDKQYLGCLPEDISLILNQHIKLGSKFHAFIRFCLPKQVSVFVKETKKSARLKGLPPFSTNKNNNTGILKHHTPMNSPLQIYDPEQEEE